MCVNICFGAAVFAKPFWDAVVLELECPEVVANANPGPRVRVALSSSSHRGDV